MSIKKRTVTLTGDNATGAGALTGVTGVGHASGVLGLGSAYARIEQIRAYGTAGDATGSMLIVDADGVEIMGFDQIDTSGTFAAETTFGSRAATFLGANAVTGSGRGVLGVGVPFINPGGDTAAVVAADTVTGSGSGLHHPIAKSPITVYLDDIAAAVVTVDIFVSE